MPAAALIKLNAPAHRNLTCVKRNVRKSIYRDFQRG
jgi:hypothetical protein